MNLPPTSGIYIPGYHVFERQDAVYSKPKKSRAITQFFEKDTGTLRCEECRHGDHGSPNVAQRKAHRRPPTELQGVTDTSDIHALNADNITKDIRKVWLVYCKNEFDFDVSTSEVTSHISKMKRLPKTTVNDDLDIDIAFVMPGLDDYTPRITRAVTSSYYTLTAEDEPPPNS